MAIPRTKRRFQLVLIKPSHYDDEGYVVALRSSVEAPACQISRVRLPCCEMQRRLLRPNRRSA